MSASPAPSAPALAEAGLLIIHGVGTHERSDTLDHFVSPLLARVAAEGHFVHAAAFEVGDPEQPGGRFAALRFTHSDSPAASAASGSAAHEIVMIEAGWNQTFLREGRELVSPWVAVHAPRMVWEVIRFHARGPVRLLATAAMGAAFVAAGVLVRGGASWPAAGALLAGLAIAMAMVFVDDFAEVRGAARTPGDRLRALMGVFTLLIFQLQRALVLAVLIPGMLIFPVLVVVARVIASVPFLSSVGGGLLGTVEAAFTTGGVADMYAIAEEQVTAAEIHARVRNGLLELEQQVRPGGVIVVLAHSGGGPLGWWLLSEPPIHARQATKRFRYRFLSVAAALNWALRGFPGYATPLDRPLVNFGEPDVEDRTWWMNVYGTWDPVPHGPVPASEFAGWTTWPEPAAPNRAVRNLGAPVPDEHGEYWRNQQEFIPLLWRALAPGSHWAEPAAGPEQRLWSNCRLALLSALIRTRLVIIAVPVAATVALLRGQRFIGDNAYESGVVNFVGDIVGGVLKNLIGEDGLQRVKDTLESSPALAGLLVIAVLTLLAYTLTDVYTNFFWRALGRRVESLRPAGGTRCTLAAGIAVIVWLPSLVILPGVLRSVGVDGWVWAAVAAGNLVLLVLELLWFYRFGTRCHLTLPAVLVWTPSVITLPLLLGEFHLGWPTWSVITALNTIIAMAEVHWFFGCVRALDQPELATRVYGQAIGRQRQADGPARPASPAEAVEPAMPGAV